ncbi:helix-turn-helix domain-containing protein [Sulfitobacter sp. 1A13679]|uniref:helix-turn-helix domain-containing protein n=1 Tax=Sulfitobacter sp. 1A13679 TaxID=3368597 RepID=UPI003745327A
MDITEHINSNGLSRADVCKAAGISRAHLSLIEAGQRKIGVSKVRALAEALGVSVGDLRPDLTDVFGDAA